MFKKEGKKKLKTNYQITCIYFVDAFVSSDLACSYMLRNSSMMSREVTRTFNLARKHFAPKSGKVEDDNLFFSAFR